MTAETGMELKYIAGCEIRYEIKRWEVERTGCPFGIAIGALKLKVPDAGDIAIYKIFLLFLPVCILEDFISMIYN
jgi:hypothetical protein